MDYYTLTLDDFFTETIWNWLGLPLLTPNPEIAMIVTNIYTAKAVTGIAAMFLSNNGTDIVSQVYTGEN
jgi:hypothetical protein